VARALDTTPRLRAALAAAGDAGPSSPRRPTERHLEELAAELAERGGLTPRERIVLISMLEGEEYGALATQLNISPSTVKYHARNVLRKLSLSSRRGLVRLLVARRRRD
jgi:DNA-binding CsgD family transcriptional regulator